MSGLGLLVLSTMVFAGGVWLVVTGFRPSTPTLSATIRHIHRDATSNRVETRSVDWIDRVGSTIERRTVLVASSAQPSMFRLIGRTPARHGGLLAVGAGLGFVGPTLSVVALDAAGVIDGGAFVPLGVGLAGAVLVPLVAHSAAVSLADERRVDMRHQLSAFLDMVTMLLAGNSGHEGALEQAARAGDGQLFVELRRRMREVAATGHSLVGALHVVALDYDIVELEQVAAATELSAAEGAPVARTLSAKCATLRSTIAADHEANARVRADKVTPPLVGMALLFMAVIIYPALDLG